MSEFYKEITPSGFGIAIKKKEVLFSDNSPFQKVEVFEFSFYTSRIFSFYRSI